MTHDAIGAEMEHYRTDELLVSRRTSDQALGVLLEKLGWKGILIFENDPRDPLLINVKEAGD